MKYRDSLINATNYEIAPICVNVMQKYCRLFPTRCTSLKMCYTCCEKIVLVL